MITTSVTLLGFAVAMGLALAALALREGGGRPRRVPLAALAHGSLGVAGLAVLLIALQGPVRGLRTGTSSFGLIAAILFAVAIALGLLLRFVHRRRAGTSGALISAHAGAAIAGFTILLAWAGLD